MKSVDEHIFRQIAELSAETFRIQRQMNILMPINFISFLGVILAAQKFL